MATDVLRHLQLDRVDFIPSALPPHKSTGELATTEDRLAMVRLALGDHSRLRLCDAEARRSGPSYTIDTVRQIKRDASAAAAFSFILGMDAFLEIHTWKYFEQLFDEMAFVVVSRPGSGLWTLSMRRDVEAYTRRHLSETYRLSGAGDRLTHPSRQEIILISVTPMDIASSQIRHMVRQGESIADWVASPVARYIQQKGLYQ